MKKTCPPRQKICGGGHKCCPDESKDKEEVLSYQLLCLNFDTLKLPLRFSKAGREFCGGALETHWATCHNGVTPRLLVVLTLSFLSYRRRKKLLRIKTRIRKRTPIQILTQVAQALARILEEQEVLISVRLRNYLTESENFLKS